MKISSTRTVNSVISLLLFFVVNCAPSAQAEHLYCVIPDASQPEDRICMSGDKGLLSTLRTHFGQAISMMPLQTEALPRSSDPDKMVLIYPETISKGKNVLSVLSSPLDSRWHVAVDGCNSGDQNACAEQGALLIQDGYSAPRDIYLAVNLLDKSCDSDVAKGCHDLARMYLGGLALDKDVEQGVAYLKRACGLKYSESCLRLGQGFAQSFQGITRNFEKAVTYFDDACDLGNLEGCTSLGYAYAHGEGVQVDFDKSAELWSRSCDGNEKTACQNLADLYEKASTLPNKDELANEYYKKSCDLGSQSACDTLTKSR